MNFVYYNLIIILKYSQERFLFAIFECEMMNEHGLRQSMLRNMSLSYIFVNIYTICTNLPDKITFLPLLKELLLWALCKYFSYLLQVINFAP